MGQQSFIANGDIYPCRFVELVTSTTGRVTQCGTGEKVYGISQMGLRRDPYIETSGRAAIAGEPIMVFDDAEECLLELGGTVSAFDRLKSDTNGKGVATTTNLDEYGAIAIESGVAGEQIKVKVQRGQISS